MYDAVSRKNDELHEYPRRRELNMLAFRDGEATSKHRGSAAPRIRIGT